MAARSKYKDSFCKELVAHMSEGADFRSFAGKCSVAEKTIHEWKKIHPPFAEAYSIAVEKAYAWWEERNRRYLTVRKGEEPVNVGLFVLNMRNRFHWLGKDKPEDLPQETDAFSENYRTWERRKSDR